MAVTVVRDWVRAFERRDIDRLLALTSPHLEYTRWTGIERGHDAVRGLLERQSYGVAMHTNALRFFSRDDTVVVEVRIVGRYVDTGELAGVQNGAAVFVVRDGLVARYAPHPGLAQALAAAGLDENDQIPDLSKLRPPRSIHHEKPDDRRALRPGGDGSVAGPHHRFPCR